MTASCPPPLISKSSEPTSEPKREEQARVLCLRLLTARARTRAELAGQLTKRGYPDDVSTRVLDRLTVARLVDDAECAERDRAERLVRARLRRETLSDDDARVSRRLVAMLARRGYGQSMIYDVVSTELAAERERRRV